MNLTDEQRLEVEYNKGFYDGGKEIAREILGEIGRYHTDAPFHNFTVYLTEVEWQALKNIYPEVK